MNQDFRDMVSELSAEGTDFLVVGAYTLAIHGIVRATGDIDFWIRPTPENALKVYRALARFGAPLRKRRHRRLSFCRYLLSDWGRTA